VCYALFCFYYLEREGFFEMEFWTLVITSIGFGISLAMDAFSVSLAAGLSEPCMRRRKICIVAGTFAFFQALMPMIGWVLVHTMLEFFEGFSKFIPWIALALLGYLGGKMIIESIKSKDVECEDKQIIGFSFLMVQGVATAIDALSVGLETGDYDFLSALFSSVIIAALTFVICYAGVLIGKKFGTRLADKAGILGGCILIIIGIIIFVKGVFGL
jgi:putative Mn2+ efflux pump MntP